MRNNNILLVAFLCLVASPPSNGFGIGTRNDAIQNRIHSTSRVRSVASPLFVEKRKRRRKKPLERISSSFGITRTETDALGLYMTDDDNDDEADEAQEVPTVPVDAIEEEEEQRSGWITALLLGPPLFAKLLIVLMVKFLTDVVVFPLLFLYRLARLAKIKMLSLIRRGEKNKSESPP